MIRCVNWAVESGITAVDSVWNRAFTSVFARAARIAVSSFSTTAGGMPGGPMIAMMVSIEPLARG